MHRARKATAIGILAVAAACQRPDGAGPIPIAQVRITPPRIALAVGDSLQIHAEVRDARGTLVHPDLQWWTSDTIVARVGPGGVLVGKRSGAALVNATIAEVTGRADVTVAPAILVGAGDIADCASTGDEATAALLAAFSGVVFTAGDNVYESGTPEAFVQCYDPSWGRWKGRTRPVPGNHEYLTPGAAGYFAYFGANAGDPARGYYSYDRAPWHIVALNSSVDLRAGSPQEQWLRADLAAHPTACTLAYWHFPRFSSGFQGNIPELEPIWQALYEAGADVIVVGHDHDYERFAPQSPAGLPDSGRGIRQFVVGTGGKSLLPFTAIAANSEVRNNTTYGVLLLKLYAGHYEWEFVPAQPDGFTDAGSDPCH